MTTWHVGQQQIRKQFQRGVRYPPIENILEAMWCGFFGGLLVVCATERPTTKLKQRKWQKQPLGLSRDPRSAPPNPSPHWGRNTSACRAVPPQTHLSGKRLSSSYSSSRPGSPGYRHAADRTPRPPLSTASPSHLPPLPEPAACALCYGVADGDGAASAASRRQRAVRRARPPAARPPPPQSAQARPGVLVDNLFW